MKNHVLPTAGSWQSSNQPGAEYRYLSSASFFKWRAKFGGMDTAMMKRLK